MQGSQVNVFDKYSASIIVFDSVDKIFNILQYGL